MNQLLSLRKSPASREESPNTVERDLRARFEKSAGEAPIFPRESCLRQVWGDALGDRVPPWSVPAIVSCVAALWLALPLAAPAAPEIEGLPKPGESRRPTFAQPQEKTLANGLRIIVVERPGLPMLSADLMIKSGAEADPPKLAGLAQLTTTLLKRGTANRNAPQIAQDIEALGAKIETGAGWDATDLKLTTLSANAEPALAILADLARNPAFAPAEIERARRETDDELRLSLEEPGTVGNLSVARATLGDSPYGHPAAGTLASLTRLSRKEITAFHARTYRPDNALLVLAGNITSGDAFALAEKIFGDWKSTTQATAPLPPAVAPAPRVILVDMPNAGQAAVYLATPSITRTADDWFAGKVANALLGGGYSSRLNLEIRLKRGLSYGARSNLATRRDAGLFLATAQTKNESATEVVGLIQTEIQKLITEPVPTEYLTGRQSVLTGAFARDLETNAGYVSRLGELALYGLPLNALDQYIPGVEQTTPTDLQTFAGKHLPAAAFTVVVAGQAKIVEAPLRAAFPKLEVIPLTKLDLDSAALSATAPKAKPAKPAAAKKR